MLNSMNKEQREAVLFGAGPMLVLAGPGSGKTFVLTKRIQHLLENFQIKPNHILVITFTKSAALEMKNRALTLHPKASQVHFGTFHSIFYKILLVSGSYSGYQLVKTSVQKKLITSVLYAAHFDSDEIPNLVPTVLKEISFIKNAGISVKNHETQIMDKMLFQRIYHTYNKELHGKKYLDFDDMLLLCYEYLRKNKDERSKWQKLFQYVLIDEFQDINAVQYGIVRMLTNENRNLFVVGDDDQAIYGFRGSKPEFMKKFLTDYPEAKQILLKTNYRCGRKIVTLAQKSISHNEVRFPKEIVSGRMENGGCFDGEVFMEETLSKEAEIKWIYERILENQGKTMAVLYRTKRQAMYLTERLVSLGISVEQKEGVENFYTHFIVEDIMAYFYFVTGKNTRFYFLQFMNKPCRYINREAVKNEIIEEQELLKFYHGKEFMQNVICELYEDLRFLKKCDPYSALIYLEQKMGYKAYLKEMAGKEEKWMEYESVLSELEVRLKQYETIEKFLLFVEEFEAYFEDERKNVSRNGCRKRENEVEIGGKVNLMTYHGAKGLEFDCVFMPGINESALPHPRAVTAMEIEEERRMFYVALTRARDKLYLSCVNQKEADAPSLFWKELLI